MDLNILQQILTDKQEPSFRLKQVAEFYFAKLPVSFSEISVIDKKLQEFLAKELSLDTVQEVTLQESTSKRAYKALLKLQDNELIESVLMIYDKYNTICLSSQAGCAMGCDFCATAKQGFKRNLTPFEIVDQVVYFKRQILNNKIKTSSQSLNLVFMGMGEPFNNLEAVWQAIQIFNDPKKFNIGQRHLSISTCGLVPQMKKFTELNSQVNLSVSLNATTDSLRKKIMPQAALYSIKDILQTLDAYVKKTHRKVFLEYVLLKDVNDTKEDALRLASLLSRRKLFHVNLINYNISGLKFLSSSKGRAAFFAKILKNKKINVTVRESLGQDIAAACGQLSGKKNN